MNENQKQEFIQLINQGIQEVVIPAMTSIELELKSEFKKEINKLKNEMNQRFDEVNNKLERLDRRDDRLADEQVDIRTRLRRVENVIFKEVD